eukprot:CAMPEP_0185703498 /NCGR_PEP_ID=MMETSP1164-20130828/14710_1 /TAXON_ID=1104430 /ORGANISM="Chrysoreinhardia sp, Strain CCMP2950" /LENGTH=262 /DNA_ID=CAMNT_0028370787 /DNA_START=59 /DNA_END=847 /DNA_ORIENTATION=-
MGTHDDDAPTGERSIAVAAAFSLLGGLGGIALGVAGAVIFPFQPSIAAGPLLGATALVTCWAAGAVLFGGWSSGSGGASTQQPGLTSLEGGSAKTALANNTRPRSSTSPAHRAAILCVVVQIASSFAVLVAVTGASFDFCDTRKRCFVADSLALPGEKCDADAHKACIDDVSYLCHRVAAPDENVTVDLGLKKCEKTMSRRCGNGRRFWGFDDRDDCLDFYVQNRSGPRFRPRTSKALVIAGGALQFAVSALLMSCLRSRFR